MDGQSLVRRGPGQISKVAEYLILFSIILVLCLATYERNKVWQTSVGLWEDCFKKAPGSARVNNNLMAQLILVEQYNEAIDHGLRSLKIDNKQYYVYYNLGIAYDHLGNLPDAYKMARRATLMQKNTTTLTSLGLILQRMDWKIGDPNPPE